MAIRLFIILLFFNLSFSFSKVKLGIDILIEHDFYEIKQKKGVLFTNFAGRNSDGKLTADILKNVQDFNLIGLLAPEHGFFTTIPAGTKVYDDNYNGIPIYSLFNEQKANCFDKIPNCDIIIVDIQDIGVRSYTYISSLYYLMKSASEKNIELLILDRPNPLGGLIIDGNVLDLKFQSFVGLLPIPYIHGLTIAELAVMIKGENWLNLDDTSSLKLNIIKMEGWERWMHWDDTHLNWFPTSPHVPTVNSIWGLSTLGIFGELGIISIGIGTTSPFQYIGSPNFDANKILDELQTNHLDGINLYPTKYRPFYGIYANNDCYGFYLTFNKNNLSKPYSSGIQLFAIINKLYPELFNLKNLNSKKTEMFKKVTGTDKILEAFINHKSFEEFRNILNIGIENYINLRNKYLLYY